MSEKIVQQAPMKRPTHRISNAIFLRISGRCLRMYSVLKHVGRKSGREYITPLSAYPLGDGFVLAVLYGEAKNSDWVRNVMAADTFGLKTSGKEYVLERAEIIPASQAFAAYPSFLRSTFKSRGISEFVWAHQRQS